MAKPNYSFAKRQRDLAKEQKKEEKLQRKKAAADAFDKAIAADPARADAYYWKATNLMALATEKDGKLSPPDGTIEAFQKYLELQPTGPHAEEAKQMIAAMNASIQSSYGTAKSEKKKK